MLCIQRKMRKVIPGVNENFKQLAFFFPLRGFFKIGRNNLLRGMHGLNTLVINSESPKPHRSHIKERKKITFPWSHLTKSKAGSEFSTFCSCVFCPLFICLVSLCLPRGCLVNLSLCRWLCALCVSVHAHWCVSLCLSLPAFNKELCSVIQ